MPFSTFPWGGGRMPWNQSNLRRQQFKKFPASWFTILGTGSGYASDVFNAWDYFPLTVPRLVFLSLILKDQEMCLFIYLQIVHVQYLAELWETRVTSFPLVPGEWCWREAPLSQAQDVCAGHSSFCTERAGLPSLEQWSPTFLAPETGLVEDSFTTDQNQRDDFGIIQAKYIYCTLFFYYYYIYYYYIRSILDHQALIRSWRLGTPALNFTPTHRQVAVFVLHKGILNNTGHFGKI